MGGESNTCLIEQMLDQYTRIEKIGSGTYGCVYKACEKENKKKFVAIKRARFEVRAGMVLVDCRTISSKASPPRQ